MFHCENAPLSVCSEFWWWQAMTLDKVLKVNMLIKRSNMGLKKWYLFRINQDSPALFMSISSLSSLFLYSCAKRLTDSKLAKSSSIYCISSLPVIWRRSFSVFFPFSGSRHARIIRPPRDARSWAVALPIPVLEPERY